MTKETTLASQRALDHSSQLVGFDDWGGAQVCGYHRAALASIQTHARTLDLLWERCPDLAPKTKGELFAGEMIARCRDVSRINYPAIAAQMIDERWEPEA